MTDRAIELAAAIMACAKEGSCWSVGIACEKLINRWMSDDMKRAEEARATPAPQDQSVSARLGATQRALRDCLSQIGYANLSDAELQWEREQGNEQVVAIQRARSALADMADAKVAETLEPDKPVVRCETCRFWDTSATLDRKDNTGMCRVDSPGRDKRTGAAVWPFPEDTDWCARHKPCESPV